ncbi:carboxypeptidase-like regulatory domain-containing protein [uncultured Croceitalea sp.]|uniref:carboxypeptidase-like regulatory domain-containing protein n=1 Tax=uncultured Croceitalea sp. TaxID=1798908 RepID=UPI00374EC4B3
MSYKITIPEPCSEDWNKMSPTQKGAFCKSCAKEVIDFTNTTNRELARKIAKGDNICGRFKPEQLNTSLPIVSQNQFRRNAAMLGFTSLLALGTPLVAQQSVTPVQTPQHFVVGRIAQQSIKTEKYIVTGIVKDLNNMPLVGATIVLEGNTTGTKTNMKGEFNIVVPISKKLEKQVLWVSNLGFETQKIIIDKNTKPLTIELVEEIMILGEIAIQEYPEKKNDTINKVKNLFRNKRSN